MCIVLITHCMQFSSVSPTTNYVDVFSILVRNFTYYNSTTIIDVERRTAMCNSAIFINNYYAYQCLRTIKSFLVKTSSDNQLLTTMVMSNHWGGEWTNALPRTHNNVVKKIICLINNIRTQYQTIFFGNLN